MKLTKGTIDRVKHWAERDVSIAKGTIVAMCDELDAREATIARLRETLLAQAHNVAAVRLALADAQEGDHEGGPVDSLTEIGQEMVLAATKADGGTKS